MLSAGQPGEVAGSRRRRMPSTSTPRISASVGVGAALRGQAGDETLEHLAHLEQLGDARRRDDRDAGPASWLELDEALDRQRLQRLADRVARHVELGRESGPRGSARPVRRRRRRCGAGSPRARRGAAAGGRHRPVACWQLRRVASSAHLRVHRACFRRVTICVFTLTQAVRPLYKVCVMSVCVNP